jgi:hypothetical protein
MVIVGIERFGQWKNYENYSDGWGREGGGGGGGNYKNAVLEK